MTAVTAALIAGGSSVLVGILTLIGVIITSNHANSAVQAKLEKAQAVTDTKIEELTREVRMHNEFALRIPVMEEQIRVMSRRIAEIEKSNQGGIYQ